jgi:ribonuclease III
LPPSPPVPPYHDLEAALGYRFHHRQLLEEALRHRSFVNEHPQADLRDNERLEFLGDAVLNLIVGHVLMETYPELAEGDLSRTRAHLVNETHLAQVARSLRLGDCLQLGRGEAQTGGRDKASILSDALEAVLAAVYLDGGYRQAFELIKRRLDIGFEALGPPEDISDYKSRLQEHAQNQEKTVPVYQVVAESGPDHDKTFVVELTLKRMKTIGTGRNKKAAEQEAARKALKQLAGDD